VQSQWFALLTALVAMHHLVDEHNSKQADGRDLAR
jgi:hypothetical protein